MQEGEAYIPVEAAAAILGVTPRQAARYKDRVRTIRAGHRILYHREDINNQASLREQGQAARSAAEGYQQVAKRPQLPPSEFLEYLREREAHADQLQQQLQQAAHHIGALEAQLALCIRPEDAAALRTHLATLEQEVHRLRAELEQVRRQK